MLRVFRSASAAERLARARQFIADIAGGSEIAVVGSTRAAADDFVRSLAVERAATVGLHRFSIVQFAVQIARGELAQQGLAPLTATGAGAVAVRAAFEVRQGNGLAYFDSVADKPGFATALANTIHDLRSSGVEPDALAPLGARGADLAALMSEYRLQVSAARLADAGDIFTIAAERVQRDAAGPFTLPIILLDVPLASRAEGRFVAALAARSPEMLATVIEGDARTVAAFGGLGGAEEAAAVRTSTSLDRLQNYAFRSTPDSSYPEDGMVQFFSAPGEGRECVEMARRIQEASSAGTPFDRIAVALRSPQTYAPLLEAALERAGVPSYFARGTRRPDASGRALLALLLCAEEKLSAKRFAEYLSLGQVPTVEENGAPPAGRDTWVAANDDLLADGTPATEEVTAEPPPDRSEEHEPLVSGSLRTPWKWEELLVEAAVVGGKDRWERRLKGLATEIQRRIEAIKLDQPDSPQISKLERQLANLEHLRRFALPLLAVLAEFPERAVWGEWLTILQRLAAMVLRHSDHVLTVLAELQPIASVGPIALEEVREALATRLTEISVEPPRSRYGRVFVGTPEQLRGRSFAVVFVPGMAERIFPQKLREDPLLLDGDRQRLTGADPPLVLLRDRAAEERLRLQIAAGCAEQKIFFSYPRVEVALGRARVPSFYALDVRRTTLGRLPNIDEFEREAARSSGAELAWMAPEIPSAAVDDIEHDLAVLRPLLHADPKSVRGSARYLMELSPELGRSLRSRWQRWRRKWSTSDGLCEATESTREQLAPYRLTARACSPTSLQAFAVCPYKFLLSAIHRLSPREESVALETLDPLTKGHMYHAMLARFLRTAMADGLLPVTPANLAQAHARADEILRATAAQYHEELAPAIERVWQDEIELLRADLRGWLTQLAEHPDGYTPELIEFAFGLPADRGRDPASTPQAARLGEGWLVHGIVDLVERDASGHLRVTDHKTGKNRTENAMIVGHGEVLQPVMYSLAVECLRGKPVTAARLSYGTAAGAYTERTVVMNPVARHAAATVLRTIDEAIQAGFLPAAPRKDGCKWCDFGAVCGPREEERVERKEQEPLEVLAHLRGMP